MASATWRLTLLNRMLSPCFLIGSPLQHGRMRLTKPRGFRALQYRVWIFVFSTLFFFHYNIRCFFYISCLKVLDLYMTYASKFVRKVQLSSYDPLWMVMNGNPWLLSSMLLMSSLPWGERQRFNKGIIEKKVLPIYWIAIQGEKNQSVKYISRGSLRQTKEDQGRPRQAKADESRLMRGSARGCRAKPAAAKQAQWSISSSYSGELAICSCLYGELQLHCIALVGVVGEGDKLSLTQSSAGPNFLKTERSRLIHLLSFASLFTPWESFIGILLS